MATSKRMIMGDLTRLIRRLDEVEETDFADEACAQLRIILADIERLEEE